MPSVNNTDRWKISRPSYTTILSYQHTLFILAASSLFSQGTSSPLSGVSQYHGPSSTKLYDTWQNYSVRVAATTCATISMVSSFTAFFWFCRMEKRFRHRLIMLLIFGDLMKALWLFLLAVVSIARGTIQTESAFCQSSGFFVQYGTETSDYAVLVIAVHSALQVFRPSNQIRSDGLYKYRHQVYIGALIIPSAMAGLAFVNPRWGYMSQGPFCSLPLRPFWYRLALAWIPRYLIAIIILGLAVAIYAHVGFEFRALSNSMRDTTQSVSTETPMLSAGSLENRTASVPEMTEVSQSSFRQGSSTVSIANPSQREPVGASIDFANDTSHAQPVPGTSETVDRCYMLSQLQTYSTANTNTMANMEKEKEVPLDASRETSVTNSSPLSSDQSPHMHRQFVQRRAHIHRQLRLMFIYPLVYVLVWLIPFINHCMTYKDKFANHPNYWLSFFSAICVTLMAAIDCLIFSLRERPWRHIPSSDGTFLGSFIWWRASASQANGAAVGPNVRPSDALYRMNTEANPDTPRVQQERWKGSVLRAGRNVSVRNSGGSSEHAKMQAEIARARLELEREDRRMENSLLGRTWDVAKGRRRNTDLSDLIAFGGTLEEAPEIEGQESGNGGEGKGRGKSVSVGCQGGSEKESKSNGGGEKEK